MKLPFVPYNPQAAFSQTRRRLPHREQPGCTYFVTWRLADSVPADLIQQWKTERSVFHHTHPKPWSEETWREYSRNFERRLERWSDEGHGACHFRHENLRKVVCTSFRHFDQQRYDLVSYVVMPNHVHVLLRPYAGTPAESVGEIPASASLRSQNRAEPFLHPCSLAGILKAWKGFTAREINRALGRAGTLWMDESFDHAVRSEAQWLKFRDYIRDNPKNAGLRENEWSWWDAEVPE